MSDKNETESKVSRRGLLSAGAAGAVGLGVGVGVSPILRREATNLYNRVLLPQQPIKAILRAPDGLMIVLTKDHAVDSLNVIAPNGSALTIFKPDAIGKQQYMVEWSEIDTGRYRIVAARDREIIQSEYVEVGSVEDK